MGAGSSKPDQNCIKVCKLNNATDVMPCWAPVIGHGYKTISTLDDPDFYSLSTCKIYNDYNKLYPNSANDIHINKKILLLVTILSLVSLL